MINYRETAKTNANEIKSFVLEREEFQLVFLIKTNKALKNERKTKKKFSQHKNAQTLKQHSMDGLISRTK